MAPLHPSVPARTNGLARLRNGGRTKFPGLSRLILALASATGAIACAAVLVSCATGSRAVLAPPLIEGATYVGNKTCYECHTNISRGFPSSPHARLNIELVSLT